MAVKESAEYDNFMKEMSDSAESKESTLEDFIGDIPDV